MARSPITGLVEQFNTLTPEQQAVFLDLVDPQPEPEPGKQTRKKRATRSPRAESLSNALAKTPKVEADGDPRCVAFDCGEREDALIHDPKGGYASYHPFVPPVPAVARRSSRKSAAEKSTASAAAMSASGD